MSQHRALSIVRDQNHASTGLARGLWNFNLHTQIAHEFQIEFAKFVLPGLGGVGPFASKIDYPGNRIGCRTTRTSIDLGTTDLVEHSSLCRLINKRHDPFGKLKTFECRIIDNSLDINERIADAKYVIAGGHEE